FRAENQQWAYVSGTHGYLHVPDFVLPFSGREVAFEADAPVFRVRGCDFDMASHARRLAAAEDSHGTANSQEANLIREFSRIATSGRLEPRWGELALKTQQVVDACLRSARDDGRATAVGP